MARAKKEAALTPEERLQAALVPDWEWPYKLPENWCWTRHNSIMDIVGGAQPEKAFFIREPKEGYVQLYQTRDYGENPVPVYIPQKYATKTTDEGDILLARYGGSLGKVFRAHKGAYNVALAKVIILYPEVVDDEFLYLYYYSHFYQDFCIKAGYGRSAQAGFNKSDLNELLFPLPPFIEQQRIVDRIESLFSKLDEAKEKAQAVVDSFETRKAAILHKAFTGELTAKWREEHGVGMDSWEKKSVGELCISLKYGTAKKSDASGNVVVLRMGNLRQGEIDWSDLAYSNDSDDIEKYKLFSGDVLFNRTNSAALVGKTAIYRGEHPAIYAGYLIKLDYDHDKIIGDYLNYALNTLDAKKYCNSVKTDGVNQSNINAKKIGAYSFNVPSIPEQEKIVSVIQKLLSKEQQAKEAAEAVLDQIDLMKKSILARAFRGELGTNDPSDESAVELLKEIIRRG